MGKSMAASVLTGIRGSSLLRTKAVTLAPAVQRLAGVRSASSNAVAPLASDDHSYDYPLTPLGDPSKRAFTYAVLGGARFVYASAARLIAVKFISSMAMSEDVKANASTEVDIGAIEEGAAVTVKWRGKPVFVRHRTEDEIAKVGKVPMSALKDPQEDLDRVKEPEWLVVLGVCTHLGCVPINGAGDFGGYFCPCHGSHYDTSGRIRKGPAPLNHEVPTYSIEDTTLTIG